MFFTIHHWEPLYHTPRMCPSEFVARATLIEYATSKIVMNIVSLECAIEAFHSDHCYKGYSYNDCHIGQSIQALPQRLSFHISTKVFFRFFHKSFLFIFPKRLLFIFLIKAFFSYCHKGFLFILPQRLSFHVCLRYWFT